jgi:hypothetical protein
MENESNPSQQSWIWGKRRVLSPNSGKVTGEIADMCKCYARIYAFYILTGTTKKAIMESEDFGQQWERWY